MNCQKHLFTLDPSIHYLNCARRGPLLKSAEEIGIRSIKRDRNPDQIQTEDFFNVQEEVRVLFAGIVNCNASQVALLPSTSYGFASVLNNVKAKPNGKAIIVKGEFPSGYFAMKRWADRHSNSLEVIEPSPELKRVGRDWNERILTAIDQQTSVVLLSAIHWMSGVKFDIEAIGKRCAEFGTIFIVDGTQAVGAMPLDVEACNIDALICAGYKWLFGPYSTALGFFGSCFDQGEPIEESWMNRTNSDRFSELTDYADDYHLGAGRYNVGQTSNFILMPMLREGLRQIQNWTPEAIRDYCGELTIPLKAYIDQIGGIYEEGEYFADHLFTFHLPDSIDQERLKSQLAEDKISISIRGESIRISVNVFNDKTDMEALMASIDRTVKAKV